MLQRNAMNLNELDYVAGGTISETADDSFELFDHGLLKDHWNPVSFTFKWESLSAKVDEAWGRAGIRVNTNPISTNEYFLNNQRISREEAFKHLDDNHKLVDLPK